ncbi:ATP-binding cassette subfamily B protein [Mucilaginibacter yixingensis]|uniref:Multidrug resistance-like ATP-binding protein MdlB n=1 Tax=Mucilaginibacter yixingensis TaxID=1295612 RepID=A0A2T5J8S3_9SPHI|nr:ABC transporter ATP-binding protein [Mucilaginibacter yixingensis]PTQ95799.1 ATP-binding cassette subfamily B protein [Mucilaginibacter yixingensis]
MNYNLNQQSQQAQKNNTFAALRSLLKLIEHERGNLLVASGTVLLNASINLLGPYLIGYAINHYVEHKQFHQLLLFSSILLGMFMLGLFTSYFQTKLMGSVSQRMLFTLRNTIFNKLQLLPVAFFNANKAGDLISRVNNDTDKINSFFSQSLMQFISNIAMMIGAGIALLVINIKLGLAALVPGLVIFIFTKLISPWVKRKNATNLKSTGGMSAEIQESLNNFRVIIAFNRRDYFRQRFDEANQQNYRTAIGAGLANNFLMPVYTLLASLAQLIVLTYGIYLMSQGTFTIGFLVTYLTYCVSFYNPLRQLAALWANFQLAMAGWDRIAQILGMESNLLSVDQSAENSDALVEFKNVHFGYVPEKEILHNVSFALQRGKTYAFVGPTGGGKSTTASLISRLYDPTQGTVLLGGKDIRTYDAQERSKKIGFILQEPFLFTGTVRENILYGNEQYHNYSNEQLEAAIKQAGLQKLLNVFEEGLETKVSSGGDGISLGQKQLIAFMRAVLRNPEVLILDEATANIDTVTEQLLEDILNNLPETTTRIIIAHRLNTIENADEIFFVNAGEVIKAGSFQDALDKLMVGKRAS